MRANEDIRDLMRRSATAQYEVAETMGIHATSLSVKLRKPLNDEERKKIISAIETTRKRIWGA